MGGKKPTSLSLSLYRNVFSNGQEGDDRESTQITGVYNRNREKVTSTR